MNLNDITRKVAVTALQDIRVKRGYHQGDISRPDAFDVWHSIIGVENGESDYKAQELADDIERDLMEQFEIDEDLHPDDCELMYEKLHSLFCGVDVSGHTN